MPSPWAARDTDVRCEHCGEAIKSYNGKGWLHRNSGSVYCIMTGPHDLTRAAPAKPAKPKRADADA